MFDKVQKHISIFRCDFCLELLPIKGSPTDLRKHRVYLVTENPRKHLKHYDVEESLYMKWVVCCGECLASAEDAGEPLIPQDKLIKELFPYLQAPTYGALVNTLEGWKVTSYLRSEIMIAAHFVGDRPVV